MPENLATQRARRSFRIAVRDADLHATPAQHQLLEQLVDAEQAGHITLEDARITVAHLRRSQHQARTGFLEEVGAGTPRSLLSPPGSESGSGRAA